MPQTRLTTAPRDAAHRAHFFTIAGGSITADVVLCGGRWPASLMAEMEAADA